MALNLAEVRAALQTAAREAGLPLGDDRRAVVMGPPLPPEVTSEDERVVLELTEPRDPTEVGQALNGYLPAGLHLDAAWIAQPGTPDENPAAFDAAVYAVQWLAPPSLGELTVRLREFFATADVPLVRMREKKTQRLNVRDFVRDLRVVNGRAQPLGLLMTLHLGSQGSVRPHEVLQALGYDPIAHAAAIRRVALFPTAWRASRLALAVQRRCQS